MYSNKYPGLGPVPPLLDNNLAINTAQGRVGAQAATREAPPHQDLHSTHLPRRSQGLPYLPLASALGRAGRV